jgi:hypothetical protein
VSDRRTQTVARGYDAMADTNRGLLAAAGFELELDDVATMREPEPDGLAAATFQWVLARR